MFTLVYSKQAVKVLRRLPANTARLIRAKLEELAQNPETMRNVKWLHGAQAHGSSTYRLRVGDWRVVYRLEYNARRIVVIDIDNRGRIYERRDR